MIPTKEQEREALEKIQKILSSLGGDANTSYVCRAFKGCVDDAEQNIRDDAAFSWMDRARSLAKENKKLKEKVNSLQESLDFANKKIISLNAKVFPPDDLTTIALLLSKESSTLETEARNAAARIVEAADDPISAAFKNAVTDHRQVEQEIANLKPLFDRVSTLMDKYK